MIAWFSDLVGWDVDLWISGVNCCCKTYEVFGCLGIVITG